MRLIIIGTDHELQDCDAFLKNLVASLIESEQATLIGEEHRSFSISVARQVAQSKGLPWVQIDMNTKQRLKAGIDAKLLNRMQIRYEADGTVTQRLRYAPREDGMREEFWLDRIAERQKMEPLWWFVEPCMHEDCLKRRTKKVMTLNYCSTLRFRVHSFGCR